jgi:hypothetical protein
LIGHYIRTIALLSEQCQSHYLSASSIHIIDSHYLFALTALIGTTCYV